MNINEFYPWLLTAYHEIISRHKLNKAHHSLIINSYANIGDKILIYNIISWLICKKKNFSCQQCHDCKLFQSKNHPDIYLFDLYSINIDEIRNMISNIYNFSKRGGKKIIYINADNLTDYAAHALLKIIEEPPNNSWFIIKTYNIKKILPTIRSRCIIYNLKIPNIEISLLWLQKKLNNSVPKKVCLSFLRINKYSPLLALHMINNQLDLRIEILKNFVSSIKKNIFDLFVILNHDDVIIRIEWICSFLADVIKNKYKLEQYINNIDQLNLVNELNGFFSLLDLHKILKNFLLCRHYLLNCKFARNRESILIEYFFILNLLKNKGK